MRAAEEAIQELEKQLRTYPWYHSVGVGQNSFGPVLFVYVKSARHPELDKIKSGWMGFPVSIKAVGSIHPTDNGLTVSYNDNVTKEHVRNIDDLLSPEFESVEWITVEQESERTNIVISEANGATKTALVWLPRLFDLSNQHGGWRIPHITTTVAGELMFEWWHQNRKLSIYFGDNKAEYISGPLTDESFSRAWLRFTQGSS